jgi:hypothetical protein
LAISGIALLACAPVSAKPVYKEQLAQHYGPLLIKKLHDCGTCHADEKSTEPKFNLALPKPHNAFGARLAAVAPELAKRGKKTDLDTRLDAVAGEDSDGDKVGNLLEILTGHNPGLKGDVASAAELAKAPQFSADYRKYRAAYPWRPFETVKRPIVPKVKNPGWVRNPIDAFLASEYQTRGLTPRPAAPKEVLLRRVYLDLIGLPPTREEVIAFQNDRTPDAYEKVVDRLLASPRYGERWGRHWMDVWRYSDWDGYGEEVRNGQRHLWRWRDWIIDSLNADKPYDRMIQEMLAGDELAPTDPKTVAATGFIVRNWYKFNRNEGMQKLIEGTSKAFLGLTLNCARCHDHKFDPLSQREYYAFRAFFETHDIRQDRVPGEANLDKDGLSLAFDATPNADTFLFLRGDERKPDKSAPIAPAVPAILGGAPIKIEPVNLPMEAYAPDRREFVRRETLKAADEARVQAGKLIETARAHLSKMTTQAAAAAQGDTPAVRQAREELQLAQLGSELADMRCLATDAILRTERLEDAGGKNSEEWKKAATETTGLQRSAALLEAKYNLLSAKIALSIAEGQPGVAFRKVEKIDPAAAKTKVAEAEKALTAAEAQAREPATVNYTPRAMKVYSQTSSGRRLALARWITDRSNPLAARVAINHLWLRHFGKPLAPNVFDFGANGHRPTHPALLDWLASEFMVRNWSMKAMHRLLVTSSAYRMDSVADGPSLAKDPDNVYLWRMNTRRMEAEVVRDSVLHIAGRLDLTMGGPDLDQNLGLTSKRRSVYFRHSMEKQVEFLATFDQVPPAECYERPESVMPQQALALANSELALAQGRVLAGTLSKLVVGQEPQSAGRSFVTLAYQQVLNRLPTRGEADECVKFLDEQAARLSDPKKLEAFTSGAPAPVPPSTDPVQRARESLVHVLLNHNDFVTIR